MKLFNKQFTVAVAAAGFDASKPLPSWHLAKDGSLVERVGTANPFSDFHWSKCVLDISMEYLHDILACFVGISKI